MKARLIRKDSTRNVVGTGKLIRKPALIKLRKTKPRKYNRYNIA